MLEKVTNLNRSLEETIKLDLNLLEKITSKMVECFKQGNKLLVCGNGGSAAEAQHFVAELAVRYKKERKPLAAISLTTDTSILTACSNDYDFSEVFSKQINAIANKNDILLCLSTSGNSENLIKAIKTAKELNCFTISFTGIKPSKIEEISDITLKVRSEDTPRIQEIQLFLLHEIADKIEGAFI